MCRYFKNRKVDYWTETRCCSKCGWILLCFKMCCWGFKTYYVYAQLRVTLTLVCLIRDYLCPLSKVCLYAHFRPFPLTTYIDASAYTVVRDNTTVAALMHMQLLSPLCICCIYASILITFSQAKWATIYALNFDTNCRW